jgi:D-serine deaminase-like pyridoxal phosphate-dependent protein
MQTFASEMGVELMPHFKTHRSLAIADLQLEYGAAGFCVAKLGEAEVLADHGVRRMIMAYPIVGELKFDRAAKLIARGLDLTLGVEDAATVASLGAAMSRAGVVADVAIIVDTGYRREGVPPSAVPSLAEVIATTDGLSLRGVLTHEGGAYGHESGEAFRAAAIDAGNLIVATADMLRKVGHSVDLVSVGSTATARITGSVRGLTQLRPGIYPFNDRGQVERGVTSVNDCAARVVATVVSSNTPGRALIDAGSKSLGQDRLSIHVPNLPESFGLICDRPGWIIKALSEEHGWLAWEGVGPPPMLGVGTIVQILPNHICSAFHTGGSTLVVRDGLVLHEWISDARGESR